MDVNDDTGNPAVADRKKELLLKAFRLVSENQDAAMAWYLDLKPYELQMLSTGVGDILYACAHIIAATRSTVLDTSPRMKNALNTLEPLLDIVINVKD